MYWEGLSCLCWITSLRETLGSYCSKSDPTLHLGTPTESQGPPPSRLGWDGQMVGWLGFLSQNETAMAMVSWNIGADILIKRTPCVPENDPLSIEPDIICILYIHILTYRERERYTLRHWQLRSKDDHYLIRFHFKVKYMQPSWMKQHTNHTPGPLTCLCLVQTFPEAFWGHDQCCISPVLCAEVTNHGSHSMDEFINNLDGFINNLSSGNDARIWSQHFVQFSTLFVFWGPGFLLPVFFEGLFRHGLYIRQGLPRLEVQNDELWPSK